MGKPAERFHDPRMRGFRRRWPLDEVVALIDARVGRLESESVSLLEAAGRVLAEAVTADASVPPFDRAAMDGYALRGEESFGADSYTPITFRLIGAARPGRAFAGTIGPREAIEITTGAPMPAGADTVVPAEATQTDGHLVSVLEATPPGRHVSRSGEDIEPGTVVLPANRVLRPQDLGILSALGRSSVTVVRCPNVAVIVTGDELLPAGTPARDSQIADMNSVMLCALIARDGGSSQVIGPLADDRDLLRETIVQAGGRFDALLVSGGSSTGPEDHAPGLVAELGELLAHGVALRPASPTGVGFLGEVPVLLAPGNPVSCLCAYDLIGGRIVRRLAGRPPEWPYRPVERPLARKLTSAVGRVDYARVRLAEGCAEPLAVSGASILSSTTRADGFVIVPADLEGYPAGAMVTVWLYDL
ncbi:MAG TPA: gephyrin-like molybdotransferase Glp [Isosphaeraceae bacterium]|jgi:molybdopterin molybdotransferase|nr:gephyrin-like molybdotransferase Glp [Isosphaeraceae bacterium]